MSPRLTALIAGLGLVVPSVVVAEQPASPAFRPAAYHVQLAKGMLPSQAEHKAAPASEPLPDGVKSAIGCLIAGTVGTAAATLAGGEEIISVIAGGGLPPTNRLVYMTGLLSVVFVSFCAVGQTMTPLAIHLWGEEAPPPHGTIEVHRGAAMRAHEIAWQGRTPAIAQPQPPAASFRASLRQAVAESGRR